MFINFQNAGMFVNMGCLKPSRNCLFGTFK